MYKKKNRMPVIVTGAAVGALILVLLLLSLFTKKKPEEPVEETAKHEVLIYKATGGSLEFPESYLESENDTEVRLSGQDLWRPDHQHGKRHQPGDFLSGERCKGRG